MRKKWELLIPLILLYVFSFPGEKANAVSQLKPDTLTFIQITDPHFCNLTGYHQVFVRERLQFAGSSETLSDFLTKIPGKYNADFVIVTGDNIDYYEAETTNGKMLDTQIEQYSDLLDLSEVPVFLTLGNHDITSYWVTPDSDYTNNQIDAEKAKAAWMRNLSCFREGTYYSRLFKIDTMTFRFIFLDNSYYATEEVSDGVLPFVMDPYQLRWLNAQLQASPVDIELIFMHMPVPFAKASDKDVPVEQMSAYTSKAKYYDLLHVLDTKASTRILFAGHRHFNSINNFTLKEGGSLTQVMTGAFGYFPNAWRIIKITSERILVSYPGSPETEYTVPIR